MLVVNDFYVDKICEILSKINGIKKYMWKNARKDYLKNKKILDQLVDYKDTYLTRSLVGREVSVGRYLQELDWIIEYINDLIYRTSNLEAKERLQVELSKLESLKVTCELDQHEKSRFYR